MTADTLIFTENLYLRLGEKGREVKILSDINLSINAGEKVAIVGPSGSGKTSLMMLLAGLMQPTEGGIHLKGQPIHKMNEDELAAFRQQHIGIVFQNFHLVPSLTAVQNVAFPLSLTGYEGAEKEAANWLEKVGLGHRLNHMPAQLSGGEQQRVALARALIMKPSLILADEPTGNLDSKNGEMITDLLFEMVNEYDTSLVLITHDDELAHKTDRTVQLVDGRIVNELAQRA